MRLYIEGKVGQYIEFAEKFGFAPFFSDTNEKRVIGASFIMAGLFFHLILDKNAMHIPEHWRNPFRMLIVNVPNKKRRVYFFHGSLTRNCKVIN